MQAHGEAALAMLVMFVAGPIALFLLASWVSRWLRIRRGRRRFLEDAICPNCGADVSASQLTTCPGCSAAFARFLRASRFPVILCVLVTAVYFLLFVAALLLIGLFVLILVVDKGGPNAAIGCLAVAIVVSYAASRTVFASLRWKYVRAVPEPVTTNP